MKLPKPLRFLRNIILFFFISTILAVVVYRFVPVYITPLMVIRSVQQVFKGESPRWHHTWVSSDKISPHLPMAVIASEDNRFATHNGFDFIEIQKAIKENETRKRKRGASTISSRRQRMYSYGPNLPGYAKDWKLLHRTDRILLVQRTYHGGLSQLHRNGERHLWRTSRRQIQVQDYSSQTLCRTMCTDSSHTTQPHTLRLSTPLPLHKEKARTDSTIDETDTQIPAK